MPFFPNPDAPWSNLPPELQAYYQQIFSGQPETGDYPAGFDPNAGAMPPMPPAAAGPPGIAGLEGGWAHIPMDEMSFIQELLTPRNVQRSTQFAGGSHYGPDRNKSIPAENFAQAKSLLEIMAVRDARQRSSEMGNLADTMTRTRAENERFGMPQGTEDNPAFIMGDKTANIAGKALRDVPVGAAEALLTGASETGTGTTRGSVVDPSKMFGEITDRLKYLTESARADESRLDMMDPGDPGYEELKARVANTWAEIDALQAQQKTGGNTPLPGGVTDVPADPLAEPASTGAAASPGGSGLGYLLSGEAPQRPTYGDRIASMVPEESPAEGWIRDYFGGQIPEGVGAWEFLFGRLRGDERRAAADALGATGRKGA